MNRETQKTIVFVAVALLLSGAAWVTIPDRSSTHNAFNDLGTKFFPELSDPNACTTLEVIDYDANTATAQPFKVTFKNGKWTIPSHHDYPADARDRLSKTAGAVYDLQKESIASDSVSDHEKFGVVDPLDSKAASLKGQGKRITLRDASDKVLADFIIGQPIKEHEGWHYVRVPGTNRTYGAKVSAELTSKFADWIETNLLQIDTTKVVRIIWDKTKVDPERGQVVPGPRITLERKDPSSPWIVPGLTIPDGMEMDTAKINSILTALGDLKIVGVRTKPAGLSKDLKLGSGGIELTRSSVLSLQDKGFYPTRDGQLLSNQGDMKIETVEGAVYTIRFGEVSFATGEALSAGEGEESTEAKEKDKAKTKTAEKKAGSGEENRFVLVTVAFDPKIIPPPAETSAQTLALPKDVFLRQPGTKEYEEQQKEINEQRAKKEQKRTEQLATEEKKVQKLADRFAPWYYVTPGTSFRTLSPNAQTDLVHVKAPPTAPGNRNPAMGGGMPDLGNLPFNLPGGHP